MPPRVVHTTPEFAKEVRKLQRKYSGVAAQVRVLVMQLLQGDLPGDRVPKSSVQTYKVRLPNPAARRGKRGGFRVYCALYGKDRIFLITIYSKTEQNDASHQEVQQRIRRILQSAGSAKPEHS